MIFAYLKKAQIFMYTRWKWDEKVSLIDGICMANKEIPANFSNTVGFFVVKDW